MRSDIIRAYKGVHTWAGVLTGLALFIAFYAGALTLFESTLERWAEPPQRSEATPLARSAALLETTLAARPEAAREFTLHLDTPPPLARLTWQKTRHDTHPWSAEFASDGTLEIRKIRAEGVAQFIDTLHRTAGVTDEHEIGEIFMGIVSVIYVVALVSGLIVLLPSLMKDLFALRSDRNPKRFWLDAHNLMGITALPFHLVIAFTSVVFCLHDPIYAIQNRLIYDGNLRGVIASSGLLPPAGANRQAAAMLPPEALLEKTRALAPDFVPRQMLYRNAQTTGATVRISGEDPRYMIAKYGFVTLNAVSGEVVSREYLPGYRGNWSAVVSGFFAAHFGSYGGDSVRWAYFFLGLSGAFVFYTGNLLWLETRRRRLAAAGANALPRSHRVLGALTVGVALGCMAGISVALLTAKWASCGAVTDEGLSAAAYYIVFFSCIGWALCAGAARAAVQLSWLTCAAFLAIPLTRLAAWTLPNLGLWSGDGRYGVDLAALGASLLMAAVACATARRLASSTEPGVWSSRATAR